MVNMKLLISFFLLTSFSSFAQSVRTPSEEDVKRGTIKVEKNSCTKIKDNDSIYASVDVMAEFPGGQDSLKKWLNKNLRYPQQAAEEDLQGTVFSSFIVGVDGKISNIVILNGTYLPFENETKRLIQSMPDWIPGKCNGTLVPVKVNFPLKFSLK